MALADFKAFLIACNTMEHRNTQFDNTWQGVNAQHLIGETVNWLLEFKDPADQQSFVAFKTAQFGHRFFTYSFAVFISVLYLAYWTLVMAKDPTPFAIFICAFSFAVCVPLLVILTVTKQREQIFSSNWKYFIENAFMLCCSFSVGCIVIFRTTNGMCAHLSFLDIWTCSPMVHARNLSPDFSMLTLFIPLLCAKSLPSISARCLLLAYLWAAAAITIGVVTMDAVLALPWIIVCFTVVLLLQSINSWTKLQLYLYFLKIEELQKQRNEDVARQAEDMRNLIGKIAHDIRTPLVAFSYGLDAMRSSMDQLQAATGHSAANGHASIIQRTATVDTMVSNAISADASIWGYVTTWAAALEGLQQSHLQLMMIIDRCMDYHKLSHGLPLIPKYAPTSISLVLEAVLGHVRSAQDGSGGEEEVKLEKTDVLGYIMTDPGWLQDNLLCLLSNAIRFSPPRSPVTLRIQRCGKHGGTLTPTTHSGCREEKWSNLDDEHNQNVMDIEQGRESALPSPSEAVRIEVEDCGVGLTDTLLSTLFHPPDGFAERNVGGAGLGLYCLAERVKALQGNYGVTSKGSDSSHDSFTTHHRPDHCHGAVFWFTLPLSSMMSDIISDSCLLHSSQSVHLTAATPDHRGSFDLTKELGAIMVEEHDDQESLRRSSSGDNHQYCEMKKASFTSSARGSDGVVEKLRKVSPSRYTVGPRCTHSKSQPTAAQMFMAKHLRVLIVDDSPLILKMLKMMFAGKGHAVVTTTNGYEALDMLRQSFESYQGSKACRACYDAVLVDVQMPIIDGLQMMREYGKLLSQHRAALLGAHPLIVAMSANTDHVTMQDSYTAGADHFLQKPFDMDTFYAVLFKHLKQGDGEQYRTCGEK